jgi:hypothetical protein
MGRCEGRGVLIALALAAAILLLAGCGGDSGGSAHVNEASGSTNGIPLDERDGMPPPPAAQGELTKAVQKADCFLFLKTKDEGTTAVPPDAPAPEYASQTPSSGPYVEPPHQQADGAYLVMPEPVDYLGSLHNGRVAIQYTPTAPEDAQLKLKGLYDTMYGGVLLFPNEAMSFSVAATAWRAVLGCTTWHGAASLDAVRAFAEATWGKRGKPVDVEGPTPRNPEEPDAG